MGIAAAGSVLITVLGKDLSGRARPPLALAVPPLETSPSFPSGHTLNATVVLGVSAYLVMLGRRHLRSKLLVGSVVVVFVLAMGLSRVWLGPPLAHRRHRRVAGRPGVARHGRHGAPGQGDPRPAPSARVRPMRGPGDDGAAGLEPGDGHPERRARHVVEAALLEVVHRLGVAPVLAAHPDLEARAWPCDPRRCRCAPGDRRPGGRWSRTATPRGCRPPCSARRSSTRRRRARSPRWSGSGRWCRTRRSRRPRRCRPR